MAKALVKLMLVEKIREKIRCPCKKRKTERKLAYAIAGSRILHTRKGCYHLKNTKKDITR